MMDEQETLLAERIYQSIMDESNQSARSMQSKDFQAGISDLGYCSERVRRMLDGQVPEDTDALAAFIGTAVGDHVEKAVVRAYPDAITQSEVKVTLQGEERSYILMGHPDIVLPTEGIVVDTKTAFGLAMAERNGPSLSHQFQRHCYARGAWEAGMFPGFALEEVRVANVWLDRSAQEKRAHVHMEPYDQSVVDHAGAWLDEVVYAFLQGEEADKEPPRDVCAATCGFFEVCRAYDTDVEGLIRDEGALSAVALYREGAEMEATGRKLKAQAKVHLEGVSGSTGEYLVRWTHINETVVPESVRRGYDKLEVRAIPRRKKS